VQKASLLIPPLRGLCQKGHLRPWHVAACALLLAIDSSFHLEKVLLGILLMWFSLVYLHPVRNAMLTVGRRTARTLKLRNLSAANALATWQVGLKMLHQSIQYLYRSIEAAVFFFLRP